MRSSHACGWLCFGLALAGSLLAAIYAPPSYAQAAAEAIDEELAREKQIVDRFLTVLERNPRRGTALDKIYGFHIENGSIEALVKGLRERVAAKPEDGTGWMILGLVESQRGRDAAAVEALTKAKELRKADPLAAYYLGQSLVLVGQPENAATAFEEAIVRKPAQADLLEIFQALGRVHQRAARTQDALAVWSRLEKLFPGDARVQEQIAATLVEEGQSAEALPRYEALAKTTTDDYRRTVYRMEAADLKVKLNRASDSIADLERLLARLNPESWLFREVRRKIEEVFLRTDDQDGLAKYYTRWLGKNTDDVEAMARLARVLARQARVPEAQEWLDKALKLAPSRKELRLAFIDQLIDDQRYADAKQQYVALDKANPNNPDVLRDSGKLILRDTSRPKEERQAEAEKVWRRMLAARPNDPLASAQVADLCRQAGMSDQALALYQKSVELAPTAAQYREYLGEYYHILKRQDAALATWRHIAAGPQRNAANLTRLAEVFAQFGYLKEALPEIAAACELDPKDFSLQLKAADLQIRGEEYDVALASLSRAEKLAQNDEEREAILSQQIKTYTLQNKLTDLATQLVQVTAKASATPQQFFLLARYREALHEYPEATAAISEALKKQPGNVPSLAAAARIAEQAGELQQAADLNRKLAVADRRGRSEYLERVARLETQLGRIDEALAAGRDLIAAAPGNVETYQFFADLCFRLGRSEDGITALRRAARVNPSEPSLVLALAGALAGQFRTDEAIELYWQAFEKGKVLDDRLSVIGKLTELYLQSNRLDQLLERLERGRREADQRREMTICLAQAHQSAGDFGRARQELERLLQENTRDTQLLLQLSKLAESESDLISAIKYQEQLAKLAPGDETEYRLATLLARAGDATESAAILVRLASKEEDQERLMRNIDSLLTSGQEETALAILEPKLRENPTEWELLYRQGAALAKRNSDQAPARFVALLDLPLLDDELGIAAKNRQKNAKSRATARPAVRSRGWRLDYAYEIRRAVGADQEPYYGGTSRRPVWTPQDFGQARMAAIGWLWRLAANENKEEPFLTERRQRALANEATPRELWDWVYLQGVRQETEDVLPAGKRLAERGGITEKLLYLMQLASRGGDEAEAAPGKEKEDKTPPLAKDELELALRCFDEVQRMPPDPEHSLRYYAQASAFTILRELARAGRKEEEQKLFRDFVDRAATIEELVSALQLVRSRGDHANFLALFDRFAAKDLQTAPQQSATARGWLQSVAQEVGQFIGRTDATPQEIQSGLDRYLSYHAAKVNQARNSPSFRPSRSSMAARQNNYVYVWSGNSQRYVTLPYPAPGDYFDQQALGLLRGAFEAFRGKDLASDLIQHLESRAAQVSAAEKLYVVLATGYVQVWNDDREAAVATLAKAADLVPQDMDLRLEVARLNLEMQQIDEALALADAIAPLDQRTMQQRETLALDLAVRLGDHQRARDAAQRLFGLRLDAETQVTLAGQMRRLGMNEEAEAVLARAQRQAGSRLSALSALMGQYQAEGRMEVAAQVAFQILRRSRTAPSAQQAAGYSTADSASRTAALACLAQAGKLKELIAGLEQQLERSPQATQLSETLSEYYQAAGDVQKMLDLQAKLVAQRPDDADVRFRYGQELYRRGKANEACEQFIAVIKTQPQLLGRRYYEVAQAFQRANKQADLARALSEIDLKRLGQPYVVMNLLNYMMQGSARAAADNRSATLIIFKKAWEAFPDQRSQLMSNFRDAEMWKLPEVIEYGKKSLIPTATALRNDPWFGLHTTSSWDYEGRMTSLLSQVLDGAARSNQMEKLRTDVVAAVGQFPQWKAGPMMLAAMDVRQGKSRDLAATIQPLLDAEGNEYFLYYARWIIAQELAAKPQYKELAIQLYERASERTNEDANNNGFQQTPEPRLVQLYKDAGQRDKARQVLLRATLREPRRDQNYQYYMGNYADGLVRIGQVLQELEMPIDALRVYRILLTKPEFSDPGISNYSGRQPEYFRGQGRQGIQAVLKKLGQKPSSEMISALLTSEGKAAPAAPAIDLMLSAIPTGASALPTLESPLASLLRPAGLGEQAVSQIEVHLASLAAQHPADLSVQIAMALFALKGSDPAKIQSALARLNQVVEQSPLEQLPPGKRANSRQRAEAAPQIGLWLVARECFKNAERRALAEPLARRATAAAQRQLEPAELTAILYERGRLALDSGDRAAAEQYWNELIQLALVEPRLPRASQSAPAAPMATAASVRPPAPAPTAAPRIGKMPATLSQFKLGASISLAAAENNLVALSLRAIREALSGGIPVADLPKGGADAFGGPRIVRASPAAMPGSRSDIDQAVFAELSTRMGQLSQTWKTRAFPAADVCQLLEEIVFPAARPADVLLYEQAANNDLQNTKSVGKLLVDWSLQANRAAELERQIAARQSTPTDIVGGLVMLVQLSVARKNHPRAAEHLQAMVKQVESSKLASLVGLAAHAAAAALEDRTLTVAAIPLLEELVSSTAITGRVNFASAADGSPVTVLTRLHLKQGNTAAASAQIEKYLQSRQEVYARYSGDSATGVQRADLAWAANELARGENLDLILTALGRFADVTASRDRDAPVGVALWYLARLLEKLSPEVRYERLRDWTLPTNNRRSVRFVASFDGGQPIPAIFLGLDGLPARAFEPQREPRPVSNLTLLVEAARAANRIEELAWLLEPLAKEKAPGAEPLSLLVQMARREYDVVKPQLDAITARIREPAPVDPLRGTRITTIDLSDYLVARAALAAPELSEPAQKLGNLLADKIPRAVQRELITHLSRDLARSELVGLSPAERERVLAPPFKLWLPGAGPQVYEGTLPPALWAVHDGHLTHLTGFAYDALYFKVPLEGEFEFSYDNYSAFHANYAQGDPAYGGLLCVAVPTGNRATITSVAQHDQITRPQPLLANNGWNRVAIRVTPSSVRFFLNDRLAYEDKSPSRTSPWLQLQAQSDRQPVMKNFRLTGKPVIPREVRLVDGDRLEGWDARTYQEQMPQRLRSAEPASDEVAQANPRYVVNALGQAVLVDPNAPVVIDWQAADGVLEGRLDADAAPHAQSRIFYHRPLASGDRLTYQFLYEPGRTHVFPTLGKIAYLLQPQGLKLHWMTRTNEPGGPLLVDPSNVVEDPTCVRGSPALPLTENDWNDVELSLRGDVLAITLNSQLICERPVEPTSDRRFGFFHFKGESAVRVRNIVLHGDWPQSLSNAEQANLLALDGDSTSPGLSRAGHALIGERTFASAVYDVWNQSRHMPPPARYEFLKRWVLPNESHSPLRMQIDWTPVDSAPSIQLAIPAGPSAASASPLSHRGGEMIAPALALVEVAKELGKLDELATAAAIAAKEHPSQARSVTSFEALLAIAKLDDALATQKLKQAQEFVKARPKDTPPFERHTEYLAVFAALSRPALRPAATALADQIYSDQAGARRITDEWDLRIRRLRAITRRPRAQTVGAFTPGDNLALKEWLPANFPTALHRGQGYAPPIWHLRPGVVTYQTGNGKDALYLAMPLRGNFELHCERVPTTFRALLPRYAGVSFDIDAQKQTLVRREFGHADGAAAPLSEKLTLPEKTVPYKLVVQDGTMIGYVNGQRVFNEPVPADADPWLAFASRVPQATDTMRNVRIIGNPTVPREINLSAGAGLQGWSSAYYAESAEASPGAWTKSAEEIVASKVPNSEGSFRESVLQYHRPLLEDGQIEYEFFYEPGKTEVHPALDRCAFMLQPDGVSIHWLTDAQHERTGLAPDNLERLSESKPPALQAGQWSKVQVSVQGNEVAVAVNGVEVARRHLEPTNQRIFGFFRYSDASGARVRSVVHRGQWPTELPSLVNQKLVGGAR